MVALLAVEPDGSRGVGDGERGGGEVWSGVVGGLVARVEAASERRARLGERALGGGVVLGLEDELDDVALGSGDVVRVEDELAGSADDDLVDGAGSGCAGGSSLVGRDGRRGSSGGRGSVGISADGVVRVGHGGGLGGDGSDAGGDGDGGRGLSGRLTRGDGLPVGERLWVRVGGRVDGEDHSLLAVVGLGAERPDRLGVLDGDPELREVGGLALGDGHVAREEASGNASGIGDLGARVGEGRLSDGVVLAAESEADRVSGVSSLPEEGKKGP